MSTSGSTSTPSPLPIGAIKRDAVFAPTHWSVVLKAGLTDTQARDALAKLYQTYWYPLYAYARRRGYCGHDAEDVTQSFFVCLLERRSFMNADPQRGRFRSFLLGAMNHFLTNERIKMRTRKRGGNCPLLSLDLAAAEQRFELEPGTDVTPDKVFDKEWATVLLDTVLKSLEEEYQRANKGELFKLLKRTLAGTRESQLYAAIAAQLEMNEGAVRVAVHRMRKRYRELLQAEIARTVNSPTEVKEELNHLLQAMAGQ